MSKQIAYFLYFLILIAPTNYLGTLAEQKKPCPAGDDAKNEIICPASNGNYSSKNEV